jgi:medium-chain acyl-[acyl-carrier-protein] hydrolase
MIGTSSKAAVASTMVRQSTASNNDRNIWIRRSQPRTNATCRLFCFPYAGGGASIFDQWDGREVEVVAVQLPGREDRLTEAPFTDLAKAVKAIAFGISPLLEEPFAFLGHSMGGLLGFELAHELKKSGKEPFHLFVSGCVAPHLPRKSRLHHNLPRNQFMRELRQLNGTSEELLDSPEYVDLLLSFLRPDLQMVDEYQCKKRPPLSCPVTAIYGTEDKLANKRDMQEWNRYTTGSFGLCAIPGDHFFLKSATDILLELISRRILV